MLIKIDIDTKKAHTGFVNIAKAQGIASKNTLNIIAAISRRNYIKNAENNLTLRNAFTKRNIQFDRTNYLKIKRQETRTGATLKADYMEEHENGAIKKTKSGAPIAMAQKDARGGSNRRLVNKQNYLRTIRRKTVKWPTTKGSIKSRTVRAAAAAHTKNLFFKYKDNIYTITSFTKTKSKVKFKKKHMYNTSQQSAFIPSRPMLGPAIKQPVRDRQSIFNSQINKLLRKAMI